MVERGHFVLHSFLRPPVTAGRYQLRGTQPTASLPVEEHVAEVRVSSPRYLMPPDQILSTFPPAMAAGDFGSRLPQIVLKRRTLPWERNPGGPPLAANDPPRPWLALVVIAEGEGALCPDPVPVAHCVTPGRALPDPTDAETPTGYYLAVTESVVNKVFPTIEDLPLLVHVREVDLRDTDLATGDDDGWLAVVLANRLPIAVPRTDPATGATVSAEVKYLACLVNLEGQIDILPTDADLAIEDSFQPVSAVQDLRAMTAAATSTDKTVMGTGHAVMSAKALGAGVVGTSLTDAATTSPVSALADWAVPEPDSRPSVLAEIDAAAAIRRHMASPFWGHVDAFVSEPVYRFPVLAHWSFTATNEGDFRSLAQALDVGLLGTAMGSVFGVDPEGTPGLKIEHQNRPRPGDPPRPEPPEAAEPGHIALPQTTRRGDPATAWYRGPFTPLPTDRDPADWPLNHVSDQLRTLTPDGREDVSLAAAFEIGRLLGLSQPALVRALLRWRNEQFGAARAQKVGQFLTEMTAVALDESRLDRMLGRLVGYHLLTETGTRVEEVVGAVRPVVDPGAPVQLEGSLDRVVAEGLGIDLAALRERANRIGMVGALAATEVAVARPAAALDEDVVAGLHSVLDVEVDRVAVAAMRTAVAEAAPPRGRRRSPGDALDELLDRADAGDDE